MNIDVECLTDGTKSPMIYTGIVLPMLLYAES